MCEKSHTDDATASRLTISLGLVLGFWILSFGADDFWSVKKPDNWTAQETRRMLTQSPWAKSPKLKSALVVPPRTLSPQEILQGFAPGLPLGAGGLLTPGPTHVLGATPFSGGPGMLSVASGDYWITDYDMEVARRKLANPLAALPLFNSADPRLPAPDPLPDPITVRWESALPVREGERLGVIRNSIEDSDVQYYVICVSGGPFLWEKADPAARERATRSAELLRKKKAPIPATDAEFLSVDSVSTMRFYFPREVPIVLGDKEVLFRVEFSTLVIEVEFTLKEMIYRNALAL